MKLFRLLAVLMALVVPVQGVAAIVAGQCMAFGHHQDAGGHEHGATHDGDGHDHASHAHDDHAASVAPDDGGKGSHCGPCAACCASVSIPNSAPAPVLAAAADVPYLYSQFAPLAIRPAALDRPPLAL